MRILIACLVLVGGCDRVFGLERDRVPPPDAPVCVGKSGPGNTGLFSICFDGPLADSYDVPASIDTDDTPPPPCTQIIVQPDLTPACVIAAKHISVQMGSVLHGGRVVVLVATESLNVTAMGALDAATHRGLRGPNAALASCDATHDGQLGTGGGGGGGGGGFNGSGANGAGGTLTAVGGAGEAGVKLVAVRGGCAGGKGGGGVGTSLGGAGGVGGGGLYLIAGDTIEIAGTINVSGEGGAGGAKPMSAGGGGGGGGGGGSGGVLGLDAPHIVLHAGARLVANGGAGGGGGGGGALGTPGGDGSDPIVEGGTAPFKASGGTAGMGGMGRGGDGSALSTPPMAGAGGVGTGAAGGGGGGAAGYLMIYTTNLVNLGAVLSPPAMP